MFMLMLLRVLAQYTYLFDEVVIERGNRPISIKDWNYIHFVTIIHTVHLCCADDACAFNVGP